MYAADVTTVIQYTVVGLSVVFALGLLALELGPAARTALDRHRDRVRLRDHIGRLHLLPMLHRRGVSVQTFVEQLTPAELRRAAAICRNCENKDVCEDVLRGSRAGGDYSFCPGDAAISRVVRTVALHRM